MWIKASTKRKLTFSRVCGSNLKNVLARQHQKTSSKARKLNLIDDHFRLSGSGLIQRGCTPTNFTFIVMVIATIGFAWLPVEN
jgi:hypothetical protein